MARRLALLIGSSEYADASFAPLPSAAQDVALMGKVLQELGGFAVTTLLNEPWYKLQSEVARFFVNKAADDVLLLYLSGHGKRDPEDGRLYFAAHNTEADNLRGTTLAADFGFIRTFDERWLEPFMDWPHSARHAA
jgi:uncharacterized caspase-like protein